MIDPILWVSEGKHNPYASRSILDMKDRTGNRKVSLVLGVSAAYDLFNFSKTVSLTVLCQKLTQFKKDRDQQSENTSLTETESAALELFQLAKGNHSEPNSERLSAIAKQFNDQDCEGTSLYFGTSGGQETIKVIKTGKPKSRVSFSDVKSALNSEPVQDQIPFDEEAF